MTVLLQTLRKGTRFTYPGGAVEYVITCPASEHREGWVEATDLTMTDERVRYLIAEGCNGDPRDVVFASAHQVEVIA